MKKLNKINMRSVVNNLHDLGFTVSGIASMLNKTPANIYVHLKKSGRMKGRVFIREYPEWDVSTRTVLRHFFQEPECMYHVLVGMARQGKTSLAPVPPASEIKRTYKKSGKKTA